MVNLTIDGKAVSVPEGTTILQAAQQAGTDIPTLCWLEKISPTGACRICSVEIEGVDRPMTACDTPVKEGITVTTQSENLTRVRRQIMKLILVNHPLDCPVCDAGGECDLQDSCFDLEVTHQEFSADDVNPETIDAWPLIQQVPNRCIMCEKCVKVCHELIGADALLVNDKGDRAFIDKKVENCVFCGNCVAVCPTGTMISKPFKFRARPWALRKVPSLCSYCPSQCQIDINVQNNEIYRVTSSDQGTSNKGNLCVGGFFGYGYVNSPQRLTHPRVNNQASSWDAACERVATDIQRIRQESGSGALAGLASPRLSNEENYLFQKLFRAAIGSNNIDSEARFGLQRALRALRQGLGLQGASNRVEAIADADAVLVFGADPSAEAPLVDWKIQDAVRRGDGKLVIANMRRIHLSQFANSQLTYRPGSEIALANGLGRLLLDQGLLDTAELERTVINFSELKKDLAGVDLQQVVKATGLELAELERAAKIIGEAEKVALVFGGDVHRSAYGTSKSAAVANLAILCGALGEGGGLFPLSDKGNTQGVLEMGVCPEDLPGFQPLGEARSKFEQAWKCTLPSDGLDAEGILQGIESGKIRFLYLAAANPETFPNSSRWLKALEQVEVLVVQDIFPTAVTRLATVVLPGASYAEKSGSFTALDGTVRSFQQALRPLGGSREDGEIFAELYGRLSDFAVSFSRSEIVREINQLTTLYRETQVEQDDRQTRRRAPFRVAEQSLKYQLITVSDQAEGLQLLIGTAAGHFGTTSTFAPAPFEVEPEGLIRINPTDAAAVGVKDGDSLQVTGMAGQTTGKVQLSEAMPAGLLFAPYNFTELAIQRLVGDGDNRTAVQLAKA